MRLVRFDDVEWANAAGHRGGGLNFKVLLSGTEGELENFWLLLSKGDGTFSSPRHKHNFEQFRVCLNGSFSVDPQKALRPGEVGYFPEGTSYGPQKDEESNLGLVLQFGGASGSGFLSRPQILRAQEELKQVGEFEKGVFKRRSGEGRKNQDGFEAVWEHVMGRTMKYPAPRYEQPIYMQFDNFSWRKISGRGASKRNLGVFTERETRLEMIKLDAGGEWSSPREDAIALHFTMSGSGSCDGKPFQQYSAIETRADESVKLVAQAETEVLRMVLPMLHADALN
jgi:hypothetical protein